MNFRAPRWLPGGHAQTIWSATLANTAAVPMQALRRERLQTPDGDFIDVDWLRKEHDTAQQPPRSAPLLVLFHGLEGSSQSHYARELAAYAYRSGLNLAVPHFRGCSGELNRAPRAYHCGDHQEIDWILRRLREHIADTSVPLYALGVSLGGNALLRWAGEAGLQAAQMCRAIAAVSAPMDLVAGGEALGKGLNRWIYTPMFLRSMKPKALAKWDQFPGLFDRERVRRARNLREFDDAFTAPLHGFRGVEDYWQRASSKPMLRAIRIPTLILNARNDPFVPRNSLPAAHEVAPCVTLWQPQHGGHVGFSRGRWPARNEAMSDQVIPWLLQHGGPSLTQTLEGQQHG